MATLYIAEYERASEFPSGSAPIVREPPQAEQVVTIGGASTQSAAFATTTRIVCLKADAICSILVGANPTATAAKKRLAAEETYWCEVTPGHKIAVIANT